MKTIRFLFSGIFEINGRALPFLQGDIIDVEDADADRLIIGLCAVEVTNNTTDEIIIVEESPREKELKHGRKNRT